MEVGDAWQQHEEMRQLLLGPLSPLWTEERPLWCGPDGCQTIARTLLALMPCGDERVHRAHLAIQSDMLDHFGELVIMPPIAGTPAVERMSSCAETSLPAHAVYVGPLMDHPMPTPWVAPTSTDLFEFSV